MQSFLDYLLVGLVLTASVVYVLFSLGPRSLRGRLLGGAAAVLRRLPGMRALAQRLQAAAAVKAKAACGGCDNCGSESTPAAPSAGADVRIPVSKIGKR
ncbi:MAG: DUF6587 family protein [Steroidobacteraceae bacterium]|jgi:hypothetical protein